ncbi:hypothetical protein DAEQUDRAFT_464321 [Daedalea quercina L-15889]|uniref:BTB domain-containing protein n=1 Tax=Daedalea quercina L-15889 TaxID=1314783 RepID=A0A165TEP3_9APHY|nr:hypothetical protein DAEQUDRAFT_464321 [Daedalea quercina L-15889]
MVDNATQALGVPSIITPKRHEVFYINDDSVIIRVEDTLYRFHRHFLTRHSKAFETTFSLKPENEKPEGLTDEHPVLLEGITCKDFERLLCLFYPENVSDGDLSTTEEWTSVLALATKWDFAEYRQLAISRLSQLASPVDRILLGRAYEIPEWLSTAYLELCTRDDALTYEEGMRLGMRDVILLSDIRQSIRGSRVTMQDKNISILIDRKLG